MIALSDIQSMAVHTLVHFKGTVTVVKRFGNDSGSTVSVRDGEDAVVVKCFGEWPNVARGHLVEIRGQVKEPWQGQVKKEIGVDAKNPAHRIEKVEREEKTHLQDVLNTAVGSYVTVECEITDPDHKGWPCKNGTHKKRLMVKQDVVVKQGDPPVPPATLYLHVFNVGARTSFDNKSTIRVGNAEVSENQTSGAIELLVYSLDQITVLSTNQGVIDPALLTK